MVSIGEQPSNQTESKVPTSDHKQNDANISGKNEKKIVLLAYSAGSPLAIDDQVHCSIHNQKFWTGL